MFVNVPKEIESVSGVKMEDGTVMLDTKNVPKNVWTKMDDKPNNACQLGFEMDDNGACVGKDYYIYSNEISSVSQYHRDFRLLFLLDKKSLTLYSYFS